MKHLREEKPQGPVNPAASLQLKHRQAYFLDFP
ncbi:hypothetical protein CLS_11510 [[Clostridium] cf. saccharolyticum K10]|nr:hypothetical protein CLS_11510 [[Clostridium] cf. saccharolyticum K10]